MDRLAHFHFIIIFSSHRWSSTSFCSAAPDPSVLPPSPSGFSTSPPPFSLRFSLSLVKLIPTAKPREPPASRGDSTMSSERVPSDGQKIAEREILLRRPSLLPTLLPHAGSYIGNNFGPATSWSDIVSGSRSCLCVRVALIVHYTTVSELPLASLASVTRARSPGERIESAVSVSRTAKLYHSR